MILSMSDHFAEPGQHGPPAPILHFSVEAQDGSRSDVDVSVEAVLNFGYAARDREGLEAHLAELAAQGVPAPQTVPSLYSVPTDRVTNGSAIKVVGHETYAEVEYALVLTASGRWLLTVASDHTDAIVEGADVARGKGIAHDVLAPVAWWLDEVSDHTDEFTLLAASLEESDVTTQQGSLVSLLPPTTLLETLERRLGRPPTPGTIVLSGTVDGHPERGSRAWRIVLDDPRGGRRIVHTYAVRALEAEFHEPVTGA